MFASVKRQSSPRGHLLFIGAVDFAQIIRLLNTKSNKMFDSRSYKA